MTIHDVKHDVIRVAASSKFAACMASFLGDGIQSECEGNSGLSLEIQRLCRSALDSHTVCYHACVHA